MHSLENHTSIKDAASVERWQRNDTLFVVLAGLGTVLSRVPFQATLLSNHDAINYALALDHFDMRLHQPHPPGYLLYTLLGRGLNLIFHDHLTALVWFSMIFSGLAVVALYLVGREMFSRRVGAIAALSLAASPTFWMLGEISTPYTADLFASAMAGWLCYRMLNTSERATVYAAALGVGLAGAFRMQTMIFTFPLFLYALHRRPWKTIVGAVVLAGGVFGLFFIPAVVISGGLWTFVRSMRVTVPIFWSKKTTVSSAKASRYVKNAETILRYNFRVMGELLMPLALLGYVTRANRVLFWRNPKLRFLVIWIVPTWIVYLLIWPGNLGTILVCMAPPFVLAALGLDWIIQRPRYEYAMGWALCLGILAWGVAAFTILPQQPFGKRYRYFDNRISITSTNAYHRAKLDLVSELPVEGTIVYANAFRHLQYYLPAYRAFSFPLLRRSDPSVVKSAVSLENGNMETWTNIATTSLVPPDTERIVFLDLPLDLALVDHALVQEREKNGQTIYIISLPPGQQAQWTLDGLTLVNYE